MDRDTTDHRHCVALAAASARLAVGVREWLDDARTGATVGAITRLAWERQLAALEAVIVGHGEVAP